MKKTCEICARPLTERQDRFCSKPCQYKGRWANRDLAAEKKAAEKRFWSNVRIYPNGCWVWKGRPGKKGYGSFSLLGKQLYAHVVSWILTHQWKRGNLLVLHTCDVRMCVRPDHLFRGTSKDNSQDMVNKGRVCRGDLHPHAVLSGKAINIIKSEFEPGNGMVLAKRFGVSRSAITHVIHGRSWKHII